METRTDIINHLIETNEYRKYLEIGINNPDGNFTHILAEHKIGVDPNPAAQATFVETSDVFFQKNQEQFDIIFIDGLHKALQVYKDLLYSLDALTINGTIVVHDCLPTTEIMQSVPRQVSEWTGDVWRAFVWFREMHNELKMLVVDTDYGVGVIRRSQRRHPFKAKADLTYDNFVKYKDVWMNTISVDEFFRGW